MTRTTRTMRKMTITPSTLRPFSGRSRRRVVAREAVSATTEALHRHRVHSLVQLLTHRIHLVHLKELRRRLCRLRWSLAWGCSRQAKPLSTTADCSTAEEQTDRMNGRREGEAAAATTTKITKEKRGSCSTSPSVAPLPMPLLVRRRAMMATLRRRRHWLKTIRCTTRPARSCPAMRGNFTFANCVKRDTLNLIKFELETTGLPGLF